MSCNSFSPKQLRLLSWWHPDSSDSAFDGVICCGAVRSGKTFSMTISFFLWASTNFQNQFFAICGKTIASVRRNVIAPVLSSLKDLGFAISDKGAKNYLDVSFQGVQNRFYLFSGNDASSAASIQGVTLAGVLLDEVVLLNRSFVEQAVARCSIDGSRFWFNCNPENPFHWFYSDWILKRKEKNLLYLHFSMQDNPGLSPHVRKRYESLYSGAFYDRFVLGKWSASHGLVYPMFSQQIHVVDTCPACSQFVVSCDYGTVNPCSMGLWGKHNGKWFRIKEFYFDSRSQLSVKTDEDYYQDLLQLVGQHNVTTVIVDPSASSFIACIRKHGKFHVIPAKNDVYQGIRLVSDLLKQNKLFFHKSCVDSIREFSLYIWDEKSNRDAPVKKFDHAMDDIRYFAMFAFASAAPAFYALSANR